MPMSDYLLQLREKVGHDLLLLPSAAVAIHDDQMRLLLCFHADKNIWVTPGGLIEPGEQPADAATRRSEEHTSELQSHSDIVCRLLLEKKNKERTESLRGEFSRVATEPCASRRL